MPKEIIIPENITLEEAFNIIGENIQEVVEENQSLFADINGILQFDITGEKGGKWYVELKDCTATLHKGQQENVTTTFVIGYDDWLSVMQKKSDPQQLVMSGKIQIGGDFSLALKLGGILNKLMTQVKIETKVTSSTPTSENKPEQNTEAQQTTSNQNLNPQQPKEKTSAEIIEDVFLNLLPARILERSEKVANILVGLLGNIEFHILGEGGSIWNLSLTNGKMLIKPGKAENPSATLSMNIVDWLSLVQKKVTPEQLFMSSKLKIAGDVLLATKFGQILKGLL